MTTAWEVITPGAIEVNGRLMFVGYRRPIPPKPERLARIRFIVQAVNAHEDLLAACKLALAGEAPTTTPSLTPWQTRSPRPEERR